MKRNPLILLSRALLAAAVLLAATATSSANGVPLTSVKGWPNGRTSNDTPPNAIDGNINTFTWTTESFNFNNPSYLGVGFNSNVARAIRLWKTPDGGGGANIKDLTIQYTNDSTATPLDLRTWQNVTGLINGIAGTELLNATSVNAGGTVTGDVHNSPAGNGWGSLSFNPVPATGIRVTFANPGSGQVVHYRVAEFEVIPEPATAALAALCALVGLLIRRRLRVKPTPQ